MTNFNPLKGPILSIEELKDMAVATPGLFSFLEFDASKGINREYLTDLIFGTEEECKRLTLGNGIELSYDEIGNGDDIWIFYHGTRDCKHLWLDILKEASYNCNTKIYSIDLRGHGLSSKPVQEYSFDIFLEDLEEFIKEKNIENKKINLIGHSMGGSIMLLYAIKHPERVNRICTISSSLFCTFEHHPRNKTELTTKKNIDDRINHIINFTFPLNRKRLSDESIKRARQLVFFLWELMPKKIHKPLITLKRKDEYIWANIDRIKGMKYTAICGEIDRIAKVEDSRKVCERINGQLIVLNDLGHYVYAEDKMLLIEKLIDCFNGV